MIISFSRLFYVKRYVQLRFYLNMIFMGFGLHVRIFSDDLLICVYATGPFFLGTVFIFQVLMQYYFDLGVLMLVFILSISNTYMLVAW